MDIMTLFTSTRTRRTTASVVAGMTLAGAAAVGFSAPAQAATEETWDRLASCESTNRWDINTGNGFYGGLQFTLSSWAAVGGEGYPHHASKAEQIMRAEKLQDLQGWGAWPLCSKKLGLTQADADATDAAPVAVERTASVQRQAAAEQAAAEEAAAEQAAAEQWAAEQAAAEQAAAERAEAKRAAAAERAAAKQAAAERAAAQQAAAEQAVVAEAETIVVKAGDSLWKLAAEHEVEGGWTALYEANKDTVSDAAMIYVGQELVLPQA